MHLLKFKKCINFGMFFLSTPKRKKSHKKNFYCTEFKLNYGELDYRRLVDLNWNFAKLSSFRHVCPI